MDNLEVLKAIKVQKIQ